MSVDALSAFEQDSGSGLFVPRAVYSPIPWSDLQATDIPLTQPQVSSDLISSLAIGVAQGPTGAKLLRATSYGSQHVAAQVSANTFATSAANIGDREFTLQDPTWLATNPWFAMISAGFIHGPYLGIVAPNQSDIHRVHILNAGLSEPVSIGDIMYTVPFVMVQGPGSAITVQNQDYQTGLQLGASAFTFPRSAYGAVDSAGTVAGIQRTFPMPGQNYNSAQYSAGTTPSVNLPAVSNFGYHIRGISCTIWNTAATSYQTLLSITNATISQVLWTEVMVIPAVANSKDRVADSNLPVSVVHNTNVTIAFSQVIPANVFAALTVVFDHL